MPRRARLLGAKAVVTGAYALVTGLVAAFASFFAVQALLAGAGVAYATLGDPGVLRAVIGAALYLTLIALMGLGLGALTRSTSGALGTLVGVTLLVPAVAPALPGAVGQWMARFWPTTAGQDAYAVVHAMGALGPWAGLGVLALFTLYLNVAGHAVFRSRDVLSGADRARRPKLREEPLLQALMRASSAPNRAVGP